MCNNWSYGLKMATVMFMLLMVASAAEKVAESATDGKETPSASQDARSGPEHTVAKRAWQQLQGGWGKRNADDDESLEELQRRIMKLYSDQLLSNRVDENEFTPEDYDTPADKRAWKSMGNAWGKRDWSQLRGNGWGKRESQNWNNMRGLWGKRTPGEPDEIFRNLFIFMHSTGWNKLSSAWGK